MVDDLLAGYSSVSLVHAVLVHELGHVATRGTQFSLVVSWLTAPWRIVARVGIRFAVGVGRRRQPAWRLAAVAAAAIVVAVLHAATVGQWSTVGILSVLAVAVIGAPICDAAMSRAGERAADAFAADHGVGFYLAAARQRVEPLGQPTGVARLLCRHPRVEARVDALLARGDAVLTDMPLRRCVDGAPHGDATV